MYIKLLALLVLMAAAYCQDYYHNAPALKTIVRHEAPGREQHNRYTEAIIPVQTHEVYAASQNYGHASSSQSTQSQINHGHDRLQPDMPNNYFEPTPTQQHGQAVSSQSENSQVLNGHEKILHQVPELLFVPAQNPAPVHETIADDTPAYHALRVQPVQPFPHVTQHQPIQTHHATAHHGISHHDAPYYQNSHNVEYHIQHRR